MFCVVFAFAMGGGLLTKGGSLAWVVCVSNSACLQHELPNARKSQTNTTLSKAMSMLQW